MTISLDFTLLPIVRRQGIKQPDLPGLRASIPPRRPGRGRAQDYLIMHLALQGNAPLSPKAQVKLLNSLSATYFKAAGSSTAAMRVVAESLNQSLFSRNQRGSSRGMRSLGIFTMAVFRSQRLYLAQCGATHSLLIQPNGFQHFHAPSAVGRGLGMGRATPLQYYQAEVAPGDLLLISPAIPQSRNQMLLRSLYGTPLEVAYAQLLQHSNEDFEAILIEIAAGSGAMHTLQPETSKAEPTAQPQLPEEPPTRKEVSSPVAPTDADVSDMPTEAEPTPLPSEEPIVPETEPEFETPAVVVASTTAPQPEPQEMPKPSKPKREPIVGPALLTVGRAVGATLGQFFHTVGTMTRRILPDEKILDLPPSAMLFGALAVPLIIVSVASVVYFREGRARMHQEKLVQAQMVAEQALPLEDPSEVRVAWGQVVSYLDEAENYGSSEDSQILRTYAYSVLDELDIVERLDFQPGIVGGLPDGISVKKMLINADNDLYLLDGEGGYVLRATYTDQGYELDPVFNCGPVPQPLMVGPMIDIALLPRGEEDGATLLGMDANGNLLRCIPGEDQAPLAMQMAPPDLNWGEPTAFSYDGGDIYVLDPKTNSVWIYWALDGYTELPTYYFGNQIPPLQSVVDMSVSTGDLYLLHEDGHITVCNYGSYVDAPTRCSDPTEFIDLRSGYPSGPLMQDTNFSQIQFAPPPDPSLYLFDPQADAIYHLSMRLAFQRQYRPSQPLTGEEITAFAVGPSRQAFIATADQVYIAIMP